MTLDDWRPDLDELSALVRADAEAAALEEPPPHVVERANRLLRQRQAPGLLHVLARLIFDSRTRPLAAGVRALDSATRQLIFEAGDYELDLRLSANDTGLNTVTGQVLGPCPAGGRVELTRDDTLTAEANLSDQCEFALSAVPSGTYSLTLRVAGAVVEVPALDII